MPYVVEVDLSAKVEQWSKNTAVAFSDGIQGSVLISRRVKRATRDWLRFRYPGRRKAFYVYNLLAVLIYLLIKPYLQQIEQVVIGKDYPGEESERLIKVFLLNLLHREDPSLRGEFISFWEVRGSAADVLARRVYLGDKEADRKIAINDIQRLFK
jgi:hypothetical protein